MLQIDKLITEFGATRIHHNVFWRRIAIVSPRSVIFNSSKVRLDSKVAVCYHRAGDAKSNIGTTSRGGRCRPNRILREQKSQYNNISTTIWSHKTSYRQKHRSKSSRGGLNRNELRPSIELRQHKVLLQSDCNSCRRNQSTYERSRPLEQKSRSTFSFTPTC